MGKTVADKGILSEIIQWLEAILLAVIIALVIRAFLFEPVIVHGSSMDNTLADGQRLLVNKLCYTFKKPERGDIIVLKYQEGIVQYLPFLNKINFLKKIFPPIDEIDYIKRIIALPGEEIDFQMGVVYINGEKMEETYIKGSTFEKSVKSPFTVPNDCVFVMGDNRLNSRDSREIGCISYDRIKGKAFFRLWPVNKVGGLYKQSLGEK